MATLHVRNVPDILYERLRRQAESQNRSLSAEVIILLNRALDDTGRYQAAIPADIRRRRAFDAAAQGAPDNTTLLHAMREGNSVMEIDEHRADSIAPNEIEYTIGGKRTEHEVLLDDRLIAEARRVGQHSTDHDAVMAALEEYITRQRQRAIGQLFGTIEYDPEYDYKAQRRRS
jgi:plasmid stability protein